MKPLGGVLLAGGLAVAITPAFEPIQPEVLSAAGTFVNAFADVDGDDDLDLFVGFNGAANRLYRNDGGRFVDVAGETGLADARPTRAAAWADVDADGDADLLVGFAPALSAGGARAEGPALSAGGARAEGPALSAGGARAEGPALSAGGARAKGPALSAGGARAEGPAPSSVGSVLRLYRNTRGRFTDITASAGLTIGAGAVRQPAFVDIDADGDLDLFVAFRDRPNAFFRNDGGRFVDVAAQIGLADTRRSVGALWLDVDEDGDLDLVVGEMDGDANAVYRNDGGRFTDAGGELGVAWGGRTPRDAANGTVRPCAADVDGDGRLDLFFANYGRNGLFLNRGPAGFEDAAAAWGVAADGRHDTCAFTDVDHDGRVDLYVNGTVTGGVSYPDALLRNEGRTFANITPQNLGSLNADHGAQWADVDGDGDEDLALTGVGKESMPLLFRNQLEAATDRRSIRVRVVDRRGRATLAGAEVRVYDAGTRNLIGTRLVDSGSGYNSQNDMPVHIGWTGDSRVDIEVTYPAAGRRVTEVRRSHDARARRVTIRVVASGVGRGL